MAQGNDYFPRLVYSLPMPWHSWSSFFSHFRCIARPRNGAFPRILLGAFFLPVAFAAASGSARDNSEILGAREGESKCTVPDSPCRDEHVIYEIAADKDASGGLNMDGYKLVNGERVFMGTLRCEYQAAKKVLSCTSRGKDSDDWEYTLAGRHPRGHSHDQQQNSLSPNHNEESNGVQPLDNENYMSEATSGD